MVLTPLHSRSSTPQTVPFSPPLRLSPSPSPTLPPADSNAFASSSSYASGSVSPFTTSPVHSRAPSPQPGGGVRSRKPAHLVGSSNAGPASSSRSASPRASVDPDVTRPSLRKVTNDVWGAAGAAAVGGGLTPTGDEEDEGDGYVLRRDVKGKGKARKGEGRRAVSEAGASKSKEAQKDREVIVHKLVKTDTIASISLQYGITPQALRASNRLWPSDPIFLRSTLLVPLDQCNLPSSSFGVERIAREENGDLTVWQRNASGGGANGSSAEGGLGSAAERAGKEGVLLSPRARRLASASAFELSTPLSGSAPPTPPPPPNEFLDVWSSPALSSRASLDTAPPAFSPSTTTANAYLPSTNDFFSASPPPPPPTAEELVSRTVSPPGSSASNSQSHSHSFSGSRPPSSAATSPPPPLSGPNSADYPTSPLEKRTLRIERRAASELAFFPPSVAGGGDGPSSAPSKHRPPSSSSGPGSKHPPGSNGAPAPVADEDESLFFGPLTNSLTSSFSALGLDRYLTLPSSLSSGGARGAIALPPSPGSGRSTPRKAPGGGGGEGGKSKWSLFNFGAEEAEAGMGAGGGGIGLGDYFSPSSSSSSSSAAAARTAAAQGRHTTGRAGRSGRLPPSASAGSVVGLTSSDTWARSAGPFPSSSSSSAATASGRPLPPLPPPSPRQSPSRTIQQQPPRSPRSKKLRDSNERVPTGADLGLGDLGAGAGGGGGGAAKLRGLFE
ncbi:hypothetical protein JCM6882_002788 [Rhodosporidiobolus microsporus]